MKAIFAVIGVIIILFLFGTMLTGITSAQTDSRIDTFASVTTGVGETEADVDLVTDPFNDNILNITSITSNNDDDAPLPDYYLTSTNTLTVRGLNASDTRTLIVTYNYGSLGDNSETIDRLLDIMPMLVAVAAIIILVVACFAGYQWVKGRG